LNNGCGTPTSAGISFRTTRCRSSWTLAKRREGQWRNLINVTIRIVRKDDITTLITRSRTCLPTCVLQSEIQRARGPDFAETTTDLIDLALGSTALTICPTSFSIPRNSFAKRTRAWMNFLRPAHYDPDELFTNKF